MSKYVFKPYRPIFAQLFTQEKERLLTTLTSALAIEHIGSTAVPGLGGKGIIDIAIQAEEINLELTKHQLQSLGYEFRPSFSTDTRLYFVGYRPDVEEEARRYHLHLVAPKSLEWQELTDFRDYLKVDATEREAYASVKQKAADIADEDGDVYRQLKEPVFQRVLSTLKRLKRPKVSIFTATSIDGYIARPDGSLDWLPQPKDTEEDCGYHQFFNQIDAIVMGRKTYRVISQFDQWPYLNKRVIVLSHSLKHARQEVELFSGDLQELAFQLFQEGVKHVWVDGGNTICRFLEANLIDEMTITLIPTVLGEGIRLFEHVKIESNYSLISSKVYLHNLVQLKYQVLK